MKAAYPQTIKTTPNPPRSGFEELQALFGLLRRRHRGRRFGHVWRLQQRLRYKTEHGKNSRGWPLPALVDRSFKFPDRKAFKKTNPWTRFARFSLFFWI
jgi:hypothetical protein